jgi:membrane fusion protein, copper/silver efflux system
MKQKNLITVIVVLVLLLLAIYFSKTGALRNLYPKVNGTQPLAEADRGPQGSTPGNLQNSTGGEAAQQEETEETPTVEVPLEQQQLIGVKTVEVSVRPLLKTIRTVGIIEYDERKISTVNTKIEGWIEKLYVNYSGRYVKKGEPLAEIFSPELVATQQEFINVLKWVKNKDEGKGSAGGINSMLSRDAETILEASRQRLRLWDINEDQIKKIEESGQPLRTLAIYSPSSGYVVQKTALQGMKVMPGEKLFDIADLSTVWILADIYEYEMSMIKPGETAKIVTSYFPDKEFFARIDYVYPSLSGSTRTVKVRFEIPNYQERFKPQMFTNVEVKIDLGKKLAIPDDSIIDTGTRQVVYVDKGEGYFEPREVMLGIKSEGFREVIKGVKAGEKVVASATFLIDSEAKLKNVTPLSGHKHQK